MSGVVKSHLVQIGNSRGVRIPKVWLEQLHLDEDVEMSVEANRLVIRSASHPRQGWEDQFRAMHQRGDDQPVSEFPRSTWDDQEWEW
ncbi:MAG: AbrB/MazE/SpoVT family DNA-binding domain-containing protein [Thermoguttaceae bacterium]